MADVERMDVVEGHRVYSWWTLRAEEEENIIPLPGAARPGDRDYTAFVLSGGGAFGALQVGALRALLEHGVRPDMVVGTSIGAWNGAWLARMPTLEGMEQLADAWRSVHTARVMLDKPRPLGGFRQALSSLLLLAAAQRLTLGYPSLYSGAGMRKLLDEYFGDLTFEELALPLRVIATDLTHGQRVAFYSGRLAPAVLASSAIPGVFPPVRVGDVLYVDGGTLDNCSIDTALALGARRLYIVDVGYDEDGAGDIPWTASIEPTSERMLGVQTHAVAAVLSRTTQIVGHYQLQQAMERLPEGVEGHVIRLSSGNTGGPFDFERAAEWIERGYAATRKALQGRAAKRCVATSA